MNLEDQEDVEQNLESSGQEQETEQSTQAQEGQEVEAGQEAVQEEKQIPFHEHPRFKEVIEQKNQFKQQLEQAQRQQEELQRMVEEMRRSQEANKPKPQDALMERLKGIDPEFADRFGKLNEVDTLKQELQAFNEWKSEMAAERVRMEARSTMDKLFTENNVSKELRGIYEDRITAAANRNPRLGVQDLPNVFKGIHEEMSKLLEATKRETTKNYVADKKQAAAKPSAQPKGKPAPSVQKQQFSKDPQQARADLVKQILEQSRAEKDI
jgi:hypothetical protein